MAKIVDNSVLDAALAKIATGTSISVCSTQPTTRTEAITTYMLATASQTTGLGGASYGAAADGTTSGRKMTVAQKTDIPVTNTGTALHIAICDGTTLLYVTTCTSQGLTAGNTVTVPAWTVEIADPA